MRLGDHLQERKRGIGDEWKSYPLIGVTRSGLDTPKDPIGKSPGRYKLVSPGTIVYNPMRILLGSIGVMRPGEPNAIISPDYVVFETDRKFLDPYYLFGWMKSKKGIEFVQQETRGAVRQRLKLNVLGALEVSFPDIEKQRDRGRQLLEALSKVRMVEKLASDQLEDINKLRNKLFERAVE
jgi:type I restriction enzyme, S subunit